MTDSTEPFGPELFAQACDDVAMGRVYQQLSTGERYAVTDLRQATPTGSWSAGLRNLRTGRQGWNWCHRLADPHFYRPQTSTKGPVAMTQSSPHSSPSGEVTNLTSAAQFAEEMREEFQSATPNVEALALQAGQIAEWAVRSSISAETALAGLAAGEVTGEAVNAVNVARTQISSAAHNIHGAADALLAAYEEFTLTADAFESAQRALHRHTAVAEAYAANPDAGSKQFNTLD